MLETLNLPGDLRTLDAEAIATLCEELRARLVQTVPVTGGHLSSNLGAVELTVALHRVFHSPEDRIVWDVGHQSYCHKLLTGRVGRFDTLRQLGGLSGFPDPEESEHDAFVAGHAGNALSSAQGLAIARDRSGGSEDVVAVVGDGCLTAGMAYEALNHIGQARTRMVVVLNDNGMSISPTVGSLARRTHNLRTGRAYGALKQTTDSALKGVPKGGKLRWLLRRVKAGAKAVVTPMMLFEELGLTYLGPVDGHDVRAIEQALERARSLRRPVVVHVMTVKGKGLPAAEADPVAYHGLSPAHAVRAEGTTYSDVFSETIGEMLESDSRVVVVTAAMLEGTGLRELKRQYPKRLLDVGISEQHAVTLAAGMAVGGMRPVVAIYSTFLQRAFDQIVHDVCLPNLPVVFALDRAGIVGEDGKTHQGIFDIGYLGVMPNMTVLAPRDGEMLRRMLLDVAAVNGPVAIRYPRCASDLLDIPSGDITTPEVLREGADVTIVAVGTMVGPALEAATRAADQGIDVGVIDPKVAAPVKAREVASLSVSGRFLTVEDHVLSNGFGRSFAAELAGCGVSGAEVHVLALPTEFIPHGSRSELLSRYGLDPQGIAEACWAIAHGRPGTAPGSGAGVRALLRPTDF